MSINNGWIPALVNPNVIQAGIITTDVSHQFVIPAQPAPYLSGAGIQFLRH